MVKIGVLGAGSWGLGLAMLLHNNGHDVTVWSVFPDEINELNATRENKKCLHQLDQRIYPVGKIYT